MSRYLLHNFVLFPCRINFGILLHNLLSDFINQLTCFPSTPSLNFSTSLVLQIRISGLRDLDKFVADFSGHYGHQDKQDLKFSFHSTLETSYLS